MPGHVPVLRQEAARLLVTDPEGTYVDATLGSCGHAREVLSLLRGEGRLIGADWDTAAVERARAHPPAPAPRFEAVHARFSELESLLESRGLKPVAGILADLGVSSDQLDDPSRGLSFGQEGPLDMRLDRSGGVTADDLIRRLDDRELARVLSELGELPRAHAAARAIRRASREAVPLTTQALRRALEPLYRGPSRPRRLAQAFQALRIAVNREISEIETLLEAAPRLVRPGGTLCVIAYHSLEDRLVKHAIRPPRSLDAWPAPPESPWTALTPKPIRPPEAERSRNPRAESARLRAARRKETAG